MIEYPKIENWASKRFGGIGCPRLKKRMRKPQAIGLHCTDGSEQLRARLNVCHWFDQPAAAGNTHLISDASGVSRYAADDRSAWSATKTNEFGLHIEFCGKLQTREQWLDELSSGGLRHGAIACAVWCIKYGFEVRLLSDEELKAIVAGDTAITGFFTHEQVDRLWPPKKNPHRDPGKDFPMLDFLLAVRGYIEIFTERGVPSGWEWS